ncbi:sulfite exporter TauE/SafE family protein [Desulfobaculum bizertense]|uniref:Probable membrane transporter protein n=1 Tax=Desulfobaculum bizertense DSM 18034 TaxID=1121442 RepID=A0A1T4X313_9BACT|nr:sulfite exporter TauE/SafE family protein [Desulfobaculum bizertense]SKA83829.1 hypothetical protein SAMN02745702_02931 [Desulfobaculum bizertense DSM 18034]
MFPSLGLSPEELSYAFLIVIFGAFSQGVAGFGLALLIGPLLVMMNPVFLPAPVVILVLFICLLTVYRERSAIDLGYVKQTVVGFVIGTSAAAMLLSQLPQRETSLLLGGMILLAVLLSLSGLSVVANSKTLFSAGIIGGFMGTISGVSLPPVAIALQNESAARLRGTLASVGIISIAMAIIALCSIGQVHAREIFLAAFLFPAVLIGFALSSKVAPLVPPRISKALVFALSVISSVTMIIRNF